MSIDDDLEFDKDNVYTTGQVAKICKVSHSVVLKWFDSGELKGFRIPGSKFRKIPGKYLAEFIKKYGLDNMEDRIYTTGQVAKILGPGISKQTIIRQFDAGEFEKGYYIPGSKFRKIPYSSLVKFAEKYGLEKQLENYFGSAQDL